MESSITTAPSASNTTETATTPIDRTKAFRLVVEGVATHGLPIPMSTDLHDTPSMTLRFDDDDTDAVDRWAAYLGLAAPTRSKRVHDLDRDRPWKSYSTDTCWTGSRVPGWPIRVWCLVTATDAEITAANVLATAAALDGAK
ncbi:hypothetical protein AB0B39_23770 [Micromonospora sp. NPDC049114]|uniref:hypothetical protein n=1 Tax=Micromonospora sp. NPDC049114 TaxID=3155498 RepID=UPI0033EFA909